MALTYDAAAKRYRDGGRLLTATQVRALRDGLAVHHEQRFAALADDLIAGRATLTAWARRFADLLTRYQATAYLFGRGGAISMLDADWRRLATSVEAQQSWLGGFVQDVLDGTLSDAEIAARAKLYAGAGVRDHEEALGARYDLSLPVYPADSGTPCRSACRCAWVITETDTEYQATWQTVGGEGVCAGCRGRASQYNPYMQAKGSGEG